MRDQLGAAWHRHSMENGQGVPLSNIMNTLP